MGRSETKLELEVRQLCEDEGVYLMEFTNSGHGTRRQLRVIADRKSGFLSIDDCVKLSRQIQYLIGEKQLLAEDYRLEVSSPGLDYPLREEWQFTKNIGRLIKATIQGEKGPREISGRLTKVDAEGILLVGEKAEWNLLLRDLLSARVLPELKPRMES